MKRIYTIGQSIWLVILIVVLGIIILFANGNRIQIWKIKSSLKWDMDILQAATDELSKYDQYESVVIYGDDNSIYTVLNNRETIQSDKTGYIGQLLDRGYKSVEKCGKNVCFAKYAWFGKGYGLAYYIDKSDIIPLDISHIEVLSDNWYWYEED